MINPPIPIYNGPIEIISQFDRSNAICEAAIQWLRGPHVVLKIESNQAHPIIGYIGIKAVKLPQEQSEFPVIASIQSTWSKEKGGKCAIEARFTQLVCHGNGSQLTKATFQVINFPKFVFLCLEGNQLMDFTTFILRGGGWRIECAQVENAKEVYDLLQKQGGYAATHNATMRRDDNSAFSENDLNDAINMLFMFFSFVSGRYVNALLPTGFVNEEPVWWNWGSPIIDEWVSVISWIDPHHAEVIQETFGKFADLWVLGQWRITLQNIVHWYVASNKNVALLDTSLVLSQNSLDLLAWETLVQHDRKLSANKYKNMHVDERIRQLLGHCNIPANELPHEWWARRGD